MLRIATTAGEIFDLDLRCNRIRCVNRSCVLGIQTVAAGVWHSFDEFDYLQRGVGLRVLLGPEGTPGRFFSTGPITAIFSMN